MLFEIAFEVLPKENRLKRNKDFEQVFKKGKGLRKDFLFLKVLKKEEESEPKFGFVVSQKISKKAVLRNKAKRKLREIVRKRIKKIKKGVDGVLVALPGIEKKSFKELERTIIELFEKAGIIDSKPKH